MTSCALQLGLTPRRDHPKNVREPLERGIVFASDRRGDAKSV